MTKEEFNARLKELGITQRIFSSINSWIWITFYN
jgi:hypothetical protein